MQHWNLTREADGLARLVFDRAGASANTLGAPVLAEFNETLDLLDRDPPRGSSSRRASERLHRRRRHRRVHADQR
jgi:3-hydroxyacyl-CoA dehydrogenase/enoyl-CoA hydratase/3-hydroxybutyryl-CoA epimerase